MEKPILVEGPAGVGKTELAKTLAAALSAELIRLQCYEGLDEAKALYEWEYPKQLLYTQILRDKIGEVTAGATTLAEAVDKLAAQEDAFFSERFLLARPLLRAIRSPAAQRAAHRRGRSRRRRVRGVPARGALRFPGLGAGARHLARARVRPFVLLTSNNARELTDALKRRCLHLFIGYPDAARELEIVQTRIPEAQATLAESVVRVVQRVRDLDLKKRPSVSETLDWARALTILNAQTLDQKLVEETLNLILKYEGDIERAREKLPELMATK